MKKNWRPYKEFKKYSQNIGMEFGSEMCQTHDDK